MIDIVEMDDEQFLSFPCKREFMLYVKMDPRIREDDKRRAMVDIA